MNACPDAAPAPDFIEGRFTEGRSIDDRFTDSVFVAAGAHLRIGDTHASVTDWVAAGRAGWRAAAATALPSLRGVADAEALGLLLSALADGRRLLLCPPDATPPACGAGLDADTGAIAVLSSGTLGPPNVLWHRTDALFATARLAGERLGIARGERVLIAVPLHHLYGLGAGLLVALLAGAEILLLPKADLLSFNAALRGFAPQTTFATPHLLRAVLQRKQGPIPGSIRVVSAGDALPEPLLAQARGCFGAVNNLYGSSELGVIAIGDAPADTQAPDALRALPGVRLSLADMRDDRGRLHVAHPFPAFRIEHQGETTTPSTPWDTGDIASIAADGGLQVHGRADLSLNRAGKLLVLADVERAVAAWPGVTTAVAVPWSRDTAAGRGFSIVVEPDATGTPPDIAALKREAIGTLPVFARPDRVHIIDRLPRLASGKPDRRTLLEAYGHE